LVRPVRSNGAVAILVVLALALLAFASLAAMPAPTQAQSAKPLLSDDFTQDTTLNASLWVVNGPAGTAYGPHDVGTSIISLVPTFSSMGMMVDQINGSQEVGTIQSIENFTPPFTATAVVEGTVSNGHTFGFALSTENASSGVVVYGNLNPTNCSHLGDCNDPSVCGSPANSNIPAGQCYYGIDAKVGLGNGTWVRTAKLYQTPNTNITYTVQISVNASGSAQYSVSQAGQVLGQAISQIGTGPFYVILEQGEGSPVAHPGPNQAYWFSVVLNSGATIVTSTTTNATSSVTSSGPPPTSSGLSTIDWLIIILLAALILFILIWFRRGRKLTVTVLEASRPHPVPRATVLAKGPENLAGNTGKDGSVVFSGLKKGDYTITASAEGFAPSVPETITVKKTIEFTIKLERTGPSPQNAQVEVPPGEAPAPVGQSGLSSTGGSGQPIGFQPQAPQRAAAEPIASQPAQPVPVPTAKQPETSATAPPREEPDELGWGGDRIRQIVKTFQSKGATSPETALTAEELGLSRLFVRIMKRRKGRTRIFIEVNGRYYLDEKALQESN